jgi:hypothetical protein
MWPFDRGESIAESDDLLAIVEGAPAYEDVTDPASFRRSDVGPCDIRPEIAELAKQNGDVPRPDSDGAAFLFDLPAALVQQPGHEGAYSVRKRVADSPVEDFAIIPIRSGTEPGEVCVRNRAIGVNFVDNYLRSGVFPPPRMPFTPGKEGPATFSPSGRTSLASPRAIASGWRRWTCAIQPPSER